MGLCRGVGEGAGASRARNGPVHHLPPVGRKVRQQRSVGWTGLPVAVAPADRREALLLVVGVLGTSTAAPLIRPRRRRRWRSASADGDGVGGGCVPLGGPRCGPICAWAGVPLAVGGGGVLLRATSVLHTGGVADDGGLGGGAGGDAAGVGGVDPAVRGERMAGLAWVGVWLAIGGALLLSGVDVAVSGRALFGDALALVGGAWPRRTGWWGRGAADRVHRRLHRRVLPGGGVRVAGRGLASGSALGGYSGRRGCGFALARCPSSSATRSSTWC